MKSDLQIVADALRKFGFNDIANEIEDDETARDIAEAIADSCAMDVIADNYGSGDA